MVVVNFFLLLPLTEELAELTQFLKLFQSCVV